MRKEIDDLSKIKMLLSDDLGKYATTELERLAIAATCEEYGVRYPSYEGQAVSAIRVIVPRGAAVCGGLLINVPAIFVGRCETKNLPALPPGMKPNHTWANILKYRCEGYMYIFDEIPGYPNLFAVDPFRYEKDVQVKGALSVHWKARDSLTTVMNRELFLNTEQLTQLKQNMQKE